MNDCCKPEDVHLSSHMDLGSTKVFCHTCGSDMTARFIEYVKSYYVYKCTALQPVVK